jgi:hypothetical protein
VVETKRRHCYFHTGSVNLIPLHTTRPEISLAPDLWGAFARSEAGVRCKLTLVFVRKFTSLVPSCLSVFHSRAQDSPPCGSSLSAGSPPDTEESHSPAGRSEELRSVPSLLLCLLLFFSFYSDLVVRSSSL